MSSPAAPHPANEKERIKALHGYQILNTEQDEAFDSLARLASYICGTPIALITLIDIQKQWHKSVLGLDVKEIPRETSFCQYTILNDELMEVNDSHDDDRFRENPLVTGDPNIRFYAGFPLTTADGFNLGALCVIDRIPRHLNDEQRIALRTLAEQVVAQLELRKQNTELMESVKTKDEFLANMSHEIRTPMNAIIGFTDVLAKTSLDNEQREYLNAVKISGENLLSIINDILDLSKIESGAVNFEFTRFDLIEILGNAKHILQGKAREKLLDLKLLVDSEVPRYVTGDSHRLSQILINLIGNGIKFTEKGAVVIAVQMAGHENGKQKIHFSVRDTGIGIPKEKLNVIFERFTQANNDTTRKYGGTGLGLNISKLLVELQGGVIEAKSQEGIGSEFEFTLPFGTAEQKSSESTSFDILENNQVRPYRILLCEDNILNQRLASTVIQSFGFQLDIVGNGRLGFERLKEESYDLILMDLQMPEMDGYQATIAIRNELKITTPIMAMTAHSLVGEKEKCLEVGMNEYIPKPFRQDELLEKINLLIDSSTPVKPVIDPVRDTGKSYVNLDYLKEISGNNAEFQKEMIVTFLEQVPQDMETLRNAVAAQNWHDIGKTAHKMKSSLFVVGAEAIAQRMSALEAAAATTQPDDHLLDAYSETEGMLVDCLEELRNFEI